MKAEKLEIGWDKKSTIRLIQAVILFSIVLGGLYFLPGYFRDRQAADLNGRTNGIVVKIEPQEISTQGFYGAKEYTYSYEVTFVYEVESKTFTNTNNFSNHGKYLELIGNIRNSNFTKSVEIAYKITDPQESMILVK